jgi:hypothetical protein
MSFDLNLQTVCNHRIDKELVTLDTDRQSLRASRPIAASNVVLFASGDAVSNSLYSVIYDSQATLSNQSRKISLKKKWNSIEDFFELSYITISGFCPKCVGLNYIDDVSYNIQGDFLTIVNELLLLQNLEKFTVTELQSNPFQLFIGTTLVKLLGQRVSDPSYLSSKVTQEINNTLSVFKQLQKQYQNTGRAVTQGELLDQVTNISVQFDTTDPSILRAEVTAQAISGKSVNFTQLLKIA